MESTDAEAEAEPPILWPPNEKNWLFGKDLILGKIEGGRRRGWQRMGWLDGIIDSMNMNLGKLQELLMDTEAWRAAGHRVTKSRTQLSDWTDWWLLSLYIQPIKICFSLFSVQFQSRIPRDIKVIVHKELFLDFFLQCSLSLWMTPSSIWSCK